MEHRTLTMEHFFACYNIGKARTWAILSLFCTLLVSPACSPTPTDASLSFYHWKSQFDPSEGEKALLRKIKPSQLFVRFFDVDWSMEHNEAVPVGDVLLDDVKGIDIVIVPVVFITNRTLQSLPEDKIPQLADQLWSRLEQKRVAAGLPSFQMLQLDCDWTAGTRDIYFKLLEIVGKHCPLSTTIRLHQLVDRERMGIPPVKRGMLMFYNMGELESWEEPNSILNLEKASPYLRGFKNYPLPLDLALPAYSWGIVFREKRFLKLINGVQGAALEGDERFYKIAPNRFRVMKSTYLEGSYIYQNDELRVEVITPDLLLDAARTLKPYFQQEQFILAIYHLDSQVVKSFDYAVLERLRQEFEN